MILFRKAPGLRLRKYTSPEPPFFCATAVLPYGVDHDAPLAIDYLTMNARSADRLEVAVTDDIRAELERVKNIDSPVLIEAAGNGEEVFRRGAETAAWCSAHQIPSALLVSTPAAIPETLGSEDVLMVSVWLQAGRGMSELFQRASAQRAPWGVVVPVIFPMTTGAAALTSLAESAAAAGASFFAPIPIGLDPTAKQSIAGALALGVDDDRYAVLFHGQTEPIQLTGERHAAAIAATNSMADFPLPPRWEDRSNWNAAVLLTLTASRMFAIELDLDLAASLARAARTIAALDKPIGRIAESASIGIIGGLDAAAAEILTQWLAGESPGFVEFVNEQWRLEM